VAGLTFYLTLSWPLSDGVKSAPVTVGSVQPMSTGLPRGDLTCNVASITDGDTLRCRDGTRIRLHAVAARERDGSCSPGHPCPSASAQAATIELRRLAGGKTLTCRSIGQSYDRVTAICWAPDGSEINCAMVRSGVALIWGRFDRESPLCRA
jgi:endonuclease YncB( thermonuclease family)